MLDYDLQMVKNPPAKCRRHKFDPWLGRSPGEGNGNPLQYIPVWKKNPRDRERSLEGYRHCPWGHKEVDATEYTGTGGAQLYFTAEEH